nr:no apical meristem (NAM) protein [Tanacetum cinerariifolium]
DEWVVCRVFHKNTVPQRSPVADHGLNSFVDELLDSPLQLPPLMEHSGLNNDTSLTSNPSYFSDDQHEIHQREDHKIILGSAYSYNFVTNTYQGGPYMNEHQYAVRMDPSSVGQKRYMYEIQGRYGGRRTTDQHFLSLPCGDVESERGRVEGGYMRPQELADKIRNESRSLAENFDAWDEAALTKTLEVKKISPSIEENGVTRPKKYSELSATKAIQADCDVKATNIILQSLPPEGRHTSLAAGTSRTYTSRASGNYSEKQRTIVCYNCKEECHMSKQCTKPKRTRDESWFKDKVLLVQAQANRQILHDELAFLADLGIAKAQTTQNVITHNSPYQADDLDAYDSYCDESILPKLHSW